MTYIYSAIIVISIFGDDLRRVSVLKEYDYFMDVPLMAIMTIFVIEILVNCISKGKEYMASIELILDIFATVSILFDISIFYEDYLAPYEK